MINNLIILSYSLLPKSVINFFGKSKFLKPLRNFILRPNENEKIIDTNVKWGYGEFYFFAPPKIASKAKYNGIENKLLKNTIKLLHNYSISEPVILDVGANYGFVSLALQNNLSKNSRIYSFEPHPSIVSSFKKSIEKNNIKNIIVENVAVGNKDGMIDINLYSQSSNILSSEAKVSKKIQIRQIQLDSYLNEFKIVPNFIKIDVDGYELEVLMGLKQTLLKFKPILVVETNDNIEIINFLKDLNYEFFNLDLEEFIGIPNNVFCIIKS